MTRATALLTASAATLAVAAAHVSPTMALMRSGRHLFPLLTTVPNTTAVALTFDDGPDRATETVLNLLDDAKATATFFVLGEQVVRSPSMVNEIVQAGHEIGAHGYSHRHHLLLAPWQVDDELRRARSTIEDTTQQPLTLFRPPHGIFSLYSWYAVDRLGWRRVLWSRWGKDWLEQTTPAQIVERVGRPKAGDIVLLHDSDRYASAGSTERMLAALPQIIEQIEVEGIVMRSVGSLLKQSRDR